MDSLDKKLRNNLEKTVKSARDIAEMAAQAALEQLGVGESAAYPHLTDTQKALRRRLRAHGRQLGDRRHTERDTQEITRLAEEVAYEHWHRMLFARFLAENHLLMYPGHDSPVAISLEECEDLAAEEGLRNGWELAARYAARMLPQIFRVDSPVFQLVLPPEHQQKLEGLVASLAPEVFTASDSLGWVYQFWQAKKKDEVNASEVKIGARELPAVTQLFTEPYMVSFLLDNALGAWWATQKLSNEDLKNATSEEELRQKASIDGAPLEYLRFVQKDDGTWNPAAGTFEAWPKELCELKTLDPCCGSGHFLVAAFQMLVPMRMERDSLSARESVDAVLRDNIHGLELDQRCVELAAFALALTAWKYPGAGGYRLLPELNVACSGLSINAKKAEWLAMAGDNTNLRLVLEELYKLFIDAPVLGSLINPVASLGKGSLFELKWEEVGPLLTKVLATERDDERSEIGVVAKGVAKAASILAGTYQIVNTNVPYLGRGGQSELLMDFSDRHYPEGSSDLATTFLMRCLDFCSPDGTASLVCSQYWLFLKSYSGLRKKILSTSTIDGIAKLGPRAFETISGEVVNVALVTLSKRAINDKSTKSFYGVDVSTHKTAAEKASKLLTDDVIITSQNAQLNTPDYRIILGEFDHNTATFGNYVQILQGSSTGDDPKFVRFYWEMEQCERWKYFQTAPDQGLFSGRNHVWDWLDDKCELARFSGARVQGLDALGKACFIIAGSQRITHSLYDGLFYSKVLATCRPLKQENFPAIFAFFESGEFERQVRVIDQKNLVTPGNFLKVPFGIDYWTKVAEEKFPNGLPKYQSSDPTQWIFHGHPANSNDALHVAVARLLGYRWPAELDTEMELADEQRDLVNRCESLLPFADEDGIVCIPPVRGESSASDRLLNLLAAAYGEAWSNDMLAQLLKNVGHAGKTLESWLREKFFTQHCKLFQNRPYIWHIWDGLRDGFAVLVNYHKLDAKLLETLIYTYLGDWISRQKQDITNGLDGAQERLDAAEALKKKLELILEGEAPLDIFVRWKSLEEQPVGWEPDLNDGVRLNIRPFMTVGDVKKPGAGVLRDKPNIKWGKDRGKDVESAPWYPVFGGDRINDHHLTLAEKRSAREKNDD